MPQTWSTEPFLLLHEQLIDPVGDNIDANQKLVDELRDDFRGLLRAPGKNDESRKKLQKGKLDLDGVEYTVNNEFIAESCMLADELDVDEMVAAELLRHGTEEQARLDRPPLMCAVILFHMRRQFILSCMRIMLDYLQFDATYRGLVDRVAEEGIAGRCLGAMKDIRTALAALAERSRSGHFLGRDLDASFVENIRYRREVLMKEHDTLAQILVLLARNDIARPADAAQLVDALEGLEGYDQVLVHHVPCVLALFEQTCGYGDDVADDLLLATPGPADAAAGKALAAALDVHAHVLEFSAKARAKLPFFSAAVELAWLVYFGGLCGRLRTTTAAGKRVEYVKDIFVPLQLAVSRGALEFFMVLASDTSADDEYATMHLEYRASLGTKFTAALERTYSFLPTFDELLFDQLAAFVAALVGYAPDLLKELRAREEELHFDDPAEVYARQQAAEAEGAGAGGEPVVPLPEYELEKAFMFVSYLYSGRPNKAQPFWADAEGNLYGFLVWASQCQTPYMIATYYDMLASLSCGAESADAAHAFMMDGAGAGGADGAGDADPRAVVATAQKTYRLSWDYLFNAFAYYVQQVNASVAAVAGPNLSNILNSRMLIPMTDLPELGDEDTCVLSSYLRIIEIIAAGSATARRELYTSQAFNVMGLLFEFLKFPTTLTGAVLAAIAAFAKDADRATKNSIWLALDEWLLNSAIVTRKPPALFNTNTLTFADRFGLQLASFADILGFITLAASLTETASDGSKNDLPFPPGMGGSYRAAGMQPYVDFLVSDVFYSTLAADFNMVQRLSLQIPCLRFINNCIGRLNPELVALAMTGREAGAGAGGAGPAGLNVELAVEPHSLAEYLRLHPGAWVMAKLFDERVYTVLFSVASIGIDEVSRNTTSFADQPVLAVHLALSVVAKVLQTEELFLDVLEPLIKQDTPGARPGTTLGLRDFEDAILFHLPVVTHFALYVNSEYIPLASVALRILDMIAKAPQFSNFEDYVTTTASGGIAGGGGKSGRANRLLSTLETADDSKRIVFGFIEQLRRADVDVVYDAAAAGAGAAQAPVAHTADLLKMLGGQDGTSELLKLKLEILQFISGNLADSPTIAHFLLGFKLSSAGDELQASTEHGGVGSPVSVLQTITEFLEAEYDQQPESFQPMATTIELAALPSSVRRVSMEILLKLARSRLSAEITLGYLREHSFFETLLGLAPFISPASSVFDGLKFGEMMATVTRAVSATRDKGLALARLDRPVTALSEFLLLRSHVLEYLAVELFDVGFESSAFAQYTRALTSSSGVDGRQPQHQMLGFQSSTAKLLELLDFLEFDIEGAVSGIKLSPDEVSARLAFFGQLNLAACLVEEKVDGERTGEAFYDLGRLKEHLSLKAKEHVAGGQVASLLDERLVAEAVEVVDFCGVLNHLWRLRASQIRCLRSWTKVLQTLIMSKGEAQIVASAPPPDADARVRNIMRNAEYDLTTFLLETMQATSPKLLDFSRTHDMRVVGELALISVSLLTSLPVAQYAIATQTEDSRRGNKASDRVHALFRVSLLALQSGDSKATFRADLYLLLHVYIHQTTEAAVDKRATCLVLQKTIQACIAGSAMGATLRNVPSTPGRAIECIATDAISGEGGTRVMALMLLRSLLYVESFTHEPVVLKSLVRMNLLLLLVRSLTRIDEVLRAEADGGRVTNYELTAFRAVVACLTEIAQSRQGAAEIIQAGLFRILAEPGSFLNVDPDVGVPVEPLPAAGPALAAPAAAAPALADDRAYFRLLAPVVRLLAACMLSMGSQNQGVIGQVLAWLRDRRLMVRSVLKLVVSADLNASDSQTKRDATAAAAAAASKDRRPAVELSALARAESESEAATAVARGVILLAQLTRFTDGG
ncbi:nucleoporin Nup186/Nup192/Nup205 [Dipodascopsis tothii]|uniref:nucleoporin Nup186/Nup192/Nup205 n=1 Tax=Dipodascopsis tothii TaxID=44089 RepID=UPI0034CF221B